MEKENDYVQKIHELEQELKIRIEDNAELYAKLCNALVQLNEANEILKHMRILQVQTEKETITMEIKCAEIEQYLKKYEVKE